ncbi:O-antigen ligase family protein [Planococcus glaciei]|uniref:O-antigen ligase family protein n=1 Tax=Planococcus glaciei TaxID=459472 RepID=UPI001C72B3DC|nr:O-antigen ligase family protein [Planococcus glaciei]MBX0313283.1 O-antigen ligase family protein [Planococcus glaciei]
MTKNMTIKENILYLGIFFSSIPLARPFPININYSDLIFVLLLISVMLTQKNNLNFDIFKDKKISFIYMFSVFIFISGFAISNILNGATITFFEIAAQYLFSLIVIPFLFNNIKFDIKKLLNIYIYSLVFVVLFGAYFYFFSFSTDYSIGGRMGSLFKNPNTLAKTIAVALPIIFYALYKFKDKKQIVTILLMLLGLMMASSFGGIIATLLSILIFYIISGRVKKLIYLAIMSAIIFSFYIRIFGLPTVFNERIMPILISGDINQAGSFNIKINLMEEAIKVISQNPLIGLGAGNYIKEGLVSTSVHNSYLLIWAEGGLLTFVGFIGILIAIVMKILSFTTNKLLFAASTAIVITMLFNFITNVHFYNRYIWIPIFVVVLGIGMSEHNKKLKIRMNKNIE